MCSGTEALFKMVCVYLTQLVKVCVDAVRSRYRADQSGFDEGTPLVHQHSLTSNIILAEKTVNTMKQSCLFISKYTILLLWLCTPAHWI